MGHSLCPALVALLMSAHQLKTALQHLGWTLVTAESCTGGLIGAMMTALPGSSEVYDRGFITYSNQSKIDLLGVSQDTLNRHGAVSPETAREMSEGALRHTKADVSVAVTGIAGPGGGSDDKPVGLVYISVAIRNKGAQAFKHIFSGDRASVRDQAVAMAFTHIIDLLEARND